MERRSGDNHQAPRPAWMKRERLPVGDLSRRPPLPGQVPPDEREGVFVHSFICNGCNLHFNVYSWKADRHTCATVTCPECGQGKMGFRHWRGILSKQVEMTLEEGEVFRHVPAPGAVGMTDSTPPGLGKREEP